MPNGISKGKEEKLRKHCTELPPKAKIGLPANLQACSWLSTPAHRARLQGQLENREKNVLENKPVVLKMDEEASDKERQPVECSLACGRPLDNEHRGLGCMHHK